MLKHAGVFIIITAVLASLLEIVDTSIVAVAIPRMQGNLGVTLDEITWVSTGYIISNAVVLPIASWLGARIGRRVYFVGCILLFTLTSMLCGLAPSFGFLVAGRVVQGAAGGALLPTSQTMIQEQFPGERSGIGSAIYGMSVMIGPALGPTLGGYLTDNYSWRSIFYINLPVGLIAAAMAYFFIPGPEQPERPESKDESVKKPEGVNETKETKLGKRRMDWVGFVLLILGIGGLQFVLERGQQDNWFASNRILIATAVTGFALPLFYLYEYRHSAPIVDVKLFSESSIRSGMMLMAAMGMVLYALVFLLPVYTDRQLGMDATHTGLLYIPGSLATMLMMPFVGHFMVKFGPKTFIGAGAVMITICLWMFSGFTSATGANDIFWPLLWRGLGLGCLFVPINAAVLSQFEGEKLGQAAGLLNLSRQIGGSFGIAGISTFLDRYGAQLRNDLRPVMALSNPAAVEALRSTQESLGSRFSIWRGISPAAIEFQHKAGSALGSLQNRLERQVFQLSFNRLMILVLAIYVFSLIPLFRMKLKKKVTGSVSAH
jgi:MFS transporter, DHA2 family, multidrug resistance protein